MTRFPRLLIVVLSAMLAGCAGYAPYNAGLEQRIIRMDERAHELLAVTRSHPVPVAESQSFLRDSLSTLEWMREDAERYGSKGPEVETAANLRERFAALQARKKPLHRDDLLGAIGSTAELRAVQFRKRSAHEWREAHPASSSSSTDTDTTTTDDNNNKCKDDKHHRHDHCEDGRHGGHDDDKKR